MSRIVIGVAATLGLCGAVAYVVLRPSLDAAQADWDRSFRGLLAEEVRNHRRLTGGWPANLEALSPPLKPEQLSMLTEAGFEMALRPDGGVAWCRSDVCEEVVE